MSSMKNERCPKCGRFVYRLTFWADEQERLIDAVPQKAFVVNDIVDNKLYDVPIFRLTEAVPTEVFVIHRCKEVSG